MKHEHDLHMDLYGVRVLMFMEIEPQSNKYNQIELSPEEFVKVSMSYGIKIGVVRDGVDEIKLNVSEEIYELPDLPEIYYDP